MERVFHNGNESDSRRIMIRIDKNCIEFFYYDQYLRKGNWVDEMEEKFLNGEREEILDEEKENNGFYWIDADDWRYDKTNRLDRDDNWHKHMKQKIWFTSDMEAYMNKSTL